MDNYIFRPIGDAHNNADFRPHARVLMNAARDLKRHDPQALQGYLCLEIMGLGYGQREAIEATMEPLHDKAAALRLGAQVCEACVKFWDCDARIVV